MLIIQPHWLFVEIGFFAMLLLMGITFPAISTLAMESERQYAGSASALLGFAPFFLGGVVSPLVGIGNIFYSTALVILACGVLGLAIYWSFVIKSQLQQSSEKCGHFLRCFKKEKGEHPFCSPFVISVLASNT